MRHRVTIELTEEDAELLHELLSRFQSHTTASLARLALGVGMRKLYDYDVASDPDQPTVRRWTTADMDEFVSWLQRELRYTPGTARTCASRVRSALRAPDPLDWLDSDDPDTANTRHHAWRRWVAFCVDTGRKPIKETA